MLDFAFGHYEDLLLARSDGADFVPTAVRTLELSERIECYHH
jgi:hypothetical protein